MPAPSAGFVNGIIRASLNRPTSVLLLALIVAGGGIWSIRSMPLDALPDVSDVQVILRTSFPGQAPQVVEDQITAPLSASLLAVPGATAVRGYSMFGDSFVYVLFEDGTDPYWARSRVMEYVGQIGSRLPTGVRPALGPDANGVGWIYEYALVDRSGGHDLAQLRGLQDWWLKLQLQSVPGVSEVATIGGMVKQLQIELDPNQLLAHNITLGEVRRAIENGNGETSGSTMDLADFQFMIRAKGYVTDESDLRSIPIKTSEGRVVSVSDIAAVRLGPAPRRGIADLDGRGEVVGAVVVMRYGSNARDTIRLVKARLAELTPMLPKGVEVIETYDRSSLIDGAIRNLNGKLIVELATVFLLGAVFLLHIRSSLVIVVVLPLSILAAFAIMRAQGISANIMSLGGIAIAVGAMADATFVMLENFHRKLESNSGVSVEQRHALLIQSCAEVGPALFVSLLVAALSFLPGLALEGQEGKLFSPLVYTKTYAMLAAAFVSITVAPVLIGLFVRGSVRSERDNPLNRLFAKCYVPVLAFALRRPWIVLISASVLLLASWWPVSRLGSEFLPAMDEGDLLYMPTTPPGVSNDLARELLQVSDRAILEVPEVASVFGKAGRADTATDPAPLEMFETTVRLKPRSEWRAGLSLEDLKTELDARIKIPGLTNTWLAPIRSRIDMLATGIRTPLGIKVSGGDLATIEGVALAIEKVVGSVPGTRSAYAQRNVAGRYIEITIDRRSAARYGMNVSDVHELVAYAIGGANVSESLQGRERYPINLRYPAKWRDSRERLRALPLVTPAGAHLTLGQLASVEIADGPNMIQSDNGRLSGSVLIDFAGRDLASYTSEIERRIASANLIPPGYDLTWSGQYQYYERAKERMLLVIPLVLAAIVLLLLLVFPRPTDVLIILGTMPIALSGGIWLVWLLGYPLSVATAIGFIALAGLATETSVVMLLYLNQAWERRDSPARTRTDLYEAITEGALLRLRPKLMTLTAIVAGLLPMMWGTGVGSELVKRIAAPMVGGMFTAGLLVLIVMPAMFLIAHRTRLHDQ